MKIFSLLVLFLSMSAVAQQQLPSFQGTTGYRCEGAACISDVARLELINQILATDQQVIDLSIEQRADLISQQRILKSAANMNSRSDVNGVTNTANEARIAP